MTTKRDSTSEPAPDEQQRLDEEIEDLELDAETEANVTGGELSSSVQKTRSEISMTFARNTRA